MFCVPEWEGTEGESGWWEERGPREVLLLWKLDKSAGRRTFFVLPTVANTGGNGSTTASNLKLNTTENPILVSLLSWWIYPPPLVPQFHRRSVLIRRHSVRR